MTATKTPIEPGIIARAIGGLKYALTGTAPVWFGPQDPLVPIVSGNEVQSVAGRQFDYPVGYNIRTKPRGEEAVSFSQMRQLADAYDLLRLVIETRKDQIAKMKWAIKPKDGKAKADAQCEEIQKFFLMPDQEHNWDDWLRMLLEDLFVLDAPALYVRKTVSGGVYALEPIDGSTIKRVIDPTGRTPLAPYPAYQQILKGLPAIDYTRDELIYRPRNVRTHKIYGQSPVEQIITTVNIALRRQMNQLSYYTEGNTPNLIFSVPETWNPDQVSVFQKFWDATNQGQSKHNAKFIPGGVKMIDTKEGALKDEFDEWLARVVCFAFSVAPTPFIKSNNRATADNAKEQALQEGLAPIQQWIKSLIDYILVKFFNAPDIEFKWAEEEAQDPLVQAQLQDVKVKNGTMTINEARAMDGAAPVDGGDDPLIFTGTGPVLLSEAIKPPEPVPTALAAHADKLPPPKESDTPTTDHENESAKEAVSKSKKAVTPIDRDRPAIGKLQKSLQKTIQKFFDEQKPILIAQVIKGYESAQKIDDEVINRILAEMDMEGWAVVVENVQPFLEKVFNEGGMAALAQLGIASPDDAPPTGWDGPQVLPRGVLDQVNEKAVDYAKDRSAELVGMKYNADGGLVENADAQWRITDSTRDMLRSDVAQAIEEGWSNDQLAQALQDNYAFSPERAENIARTETAFADTAGSMATYRESGVVAQKTWIVGDGCCEICQELDGETIGIDEMFDVDGDQLDGAPAHPQCRCAVIPVIDEDAQNLEASDE